MGTLKKKLCKRLSKRTSVGSDNNNYHEAVLIHSVKEKKYEWKPKAKVTLNL